MNLKHNNYDEKFQQMLLDLADGTITSDDHRHLEQILSNDPAKRRIYIQYLDTHAMLFWKLGGASRKEDIDAPTDRTALLLEVLEQERVARIKREAEAALEKQQCETREAERHASMLRLMGRSKPVKPVRHYVIPRPIFYSSIAALIAVAVAIFWPMTQTKAPTGPVATLHSTVGAVWGGELGVDSSRNLPRGRYELVEGLAKITYDSGAEVIFEGPAVFTLDSRSQLSLSRGKLSGLCPTEESRGFVVQTHNARIVDLGTEFGVGIVDNGEVETHVFVGEVSLTPMSNGRAVANPVHIKTNEARRVDASGSRVAVIPADESFFIGVKRYLWRLDAPKSTEDQWRSFSEILRYDGSLVAYYTFDDLTADATHLYNLARATRRKLTGRLGDGVDTQTMPEVVEGRIEGKTALRFDRSAKQIIQIPDDPELNMSGDFTLAAWVKPDIGLTRGAIVSRRVGEDVAYEMGVSFDNDGRGSITAGHLQSHPVLNDDGKWKHIAVVVDANEVRFYLNGTRVSSVQKKPDSFMPVLADVEIGSTTTLFGGTNSYAGVIDELAIFSRARSDSEIGQMYLAEIPEVD